MFLSVLNQSNSQSLMSSGAWASRGLDQEHESSCQSEDSSDSCTHIQQMMLLITSDFYGMLTELKCAFMSSLLRKIQPHKGIEGYNTPQQGLHGCLRMNKGSTFEKWLILLHSTLEFCADLMSSGQPNFVSQCLSVITGHWLVNVCLFGFISDWSHSYWQTGPSVALDKS